MPGKGATTVGWIETNRLRSEALDRSPPSSAWEGVWTSERVMQIKVLREGSQLRASGVDDWRSGDGRGDTGKIDLPGQEHHAAFAGRLRVAGVHAHLANRECTVDLTLMNTFLLVEDDNSCGDPNTSLRGIYLRKP